MRSHTARDTLLRELARLSQSSRPAVPVGKSTQEVLAEVEVEGATYRLSRLRRGDAPPLTPRELEIAHLVAHGLPTKAIALALRISPWTVLTHLRRIYARLGVNSRAAMVARLVEDGLL